MDIDKPQGRIPMNKKEISELKKQFTPDNCTISRICGCYVDSEKEKRLEMRESFLFAF